MNKITRKHLEYSEGIRYTKYLKLKSVSARYLRDRSKHNFDVLKKVSDDFHKYNRMHMQKFIKITNQRGYYD